MSTLSGTPLAKLLPEGNQSIKSYTRVSHNDRDFIDCPL